MLGARIAALRQEAGYSQAELAHRLKISPSAVGMYEQGRREPAAQTLLDMAQVFGVSVDFLLTGKVQTPTEGDALTQMLLSKIVTADRQLEHRPNRPFSRQELVVLFAALLMDS